jgi:predicted membrane channel-forming protein YqfA (hemolysin III family)
MSHIIFTHIVSPQMSSIGLACATLSVYPAFRTPQWRPYRAAMFVAMGLSSIWSVLYGIELFGFSQLSEQMGLSWVLLEAGLYITGAVLYAVCSVMISGTPCILTDLRIIGTISRKETAWRL